MGTMAVDSSCPHSSFDMSYFFALLDVISLSTIGERIGAGFDTSLSELYVVISTKSVRKICIDSELFPETCPVVLV